MTLLSFIKDYFLRRCPEALFVKYVGNERDEKESQLNDRYLKPPRVFIDDFTGSLCTVCSVTGIDTIEKAAQVYVRWMREMVLQLKSVPESLRTPSWWTRNKLDAVFVFVGDYPNVPYAKKWTQVKRREERAAAAERKQAKEKVATATSSPMETDSPTEFNKQKNDLKAAVFDGVARNLVAVRVIEEIVKLAKAARDQMNVLILWDVYDQYTELKLQQVHGALVTKDYNDVLDVVSSCGSPILVKLRRRYDEFVPEEDARGEADVRMLRWITGWQRMADYHTPPSGVDETVLIRSVDGDLVPILLHYAEQHVVKWPSLASPAWTGTVLWQPGNIKLDETIAASNPHHLHGSSVLLVDMCRAYVQLRRQCISPDMFTVMATLPGNDFFDFDRVWAAPVKVDGKKQRRTSSSGLLNSKELFKYIADRREFLQTHGEFFARLCSHSSIDHLYDMLLNNPLSFWRIIEGIQPGRRIAVRHVWYFIHTLGGLLSYWKRVPLREAVALWPSFYLAPRVDSLL